MLIPTAIARRIPRWLPVLVLAVRIGQDTTSYCRVTWSR
jgi:hypothetical protein